jgi:hypothetical protein
MEDNKLISSGFESYDLEAVYDSEIAPLVHKLHEECQRLNIPMFAAVGIMMKANGDNRIAATAYFNGIERTPSELMACHLASRGEWRQIPGLMFEDTKRCAEAKQASEATKH